MNRTSARPSRPSGFTLIELLTVITIIAILMAMLFPFISGAKESARQRKADQEVRSIVNAVTQYYTEYGQYPRLSTGAASATDEACGDTAAQMNINNCNLFNTLRNIDKDPNKDYAQNPRRQSYYETKLASSPTAPKDGFVESGGATGSEGSLFDPWGTQYCVVIDANYDNVADVAKYYKDFVGDQLPRVGVAAFCLGRDKKLGNKGDNNYKKDAELSDDRVSWSSR